MNTKSALMVIAIATACYCGDVISSTKFTGSFSKLVYETGNTYGYKIIIYECAGLWVVFHDADTDHPVVVNASVVNGLIEFAVPSEIDPSITRTFHGKVSKTHLIGKFDNSDSVIKLRRGEL